MPSFSIHTPYVLHLPSSCLRCSFWPPCFLQLYHPVFRLSTLRYVHTYPYTITWRRHAGLEGRADTQLLGWEGVVKPRPRCACDRIRCSFCGKGQRAPCTASLPSPEEKTPIICRSLPGTWQHPAPSTELRTLYYYSLRLPLLYPRSYAAYTNTSGVRSRG